MFQVLVFYLIILMLCMPFVSNAQQSINLSAIKASVVSDIEEHFEGISWYMQACLHNIIRVNMADTNTIPVPAQSFIGKSPEYVGVYTTIYKQEKTKNQRDAATIVGILIGVGACIGCVMYVSNESDDLFDDIFDFDACSGCNHFGYGF